LSRSSAATARARVTMAASRAAWVRMSTPPQLTPSRHRSAAARGADLTA
jgi:hypothetical protein